MEIMKIVSLDQVPASVPQMEGVQGLRKQVPVGVEDGTPTMSLRVFTVEPGGHTPYHSHPWEHINYILAGEGVMVDEAGTGHPIKAGDYALVLPDEKHQFRNAGDAAGELQFICLVPREQE
jgi:quercetin dioxygenase-like cupin family protein